MNQLKKPAVRIAAAAILLLLFPNLLPNTYAVRIVNMIGIYIILSTGMNILVGYTGQLSMGQAAFYGIGAYATALLNTRLGLPFLITFPLSILITAVFGLILAIPALKLKGGYLALLTIGFGEVIRLLLVNWVDLTKGPSGVTGIDTISLFGFQVNSSVQWYYIILAVVVVGLIYQKIVMESRSGRAFIAIREDDKAAELTGIDITKYKIIAFVTSAVYCSIAGVIYAQMTGYVSPDTFTSNDSNIILWTVIIGGMGTQFGPVAGGIIMVILPELLRSLGTMRMVIFGVLLMIVIIFYPSGLTPFLKQIWLRIRADYRRRKTPTET